MTSPSADTLVRTPAAVSAAAPATAPPAAGPEAVAPVPVRHEPPAPGPVPQAVPAVDGRRLIRFRMRSDHGGLHLRSGETVLCVPYEPTELGMVVLVRCERDGHAPGALLSVRELVYVEEAGRYAGQGHWDPPGTRSRPG